MTSHNRRDPPTPTLPARAGLSHLTEAPISPRPIGERPFDKRSGGPAPQAWEGEGGAQLSRCFPKQTRRRQLPLTFPSLTPLRQAQEGPFLSPRGEEERHVVAKCDSPAVGARGNSFIEVGIPARLALLG